MKTTVIRFVLVFVLVSAASLNVQGFIPDDADGDGVPDSVDVCPGEDASGFDRNGDGCIDAFIGARHIEYWGSEDATITYLINETGAPNISDGSDLTAIQNAFAAWPAVPGSDLAVAYGGTTSQAVANGLDGVNLVTFVDNSFPFSSLVLAVGLSTSFESDTLIAGRVYRKGEIFDADMVLNPTKTFKVGGPGSGTDIQAVATHEAGHMLGISHTATKSATMHYVLAGGLAARSLESDDELVWFKAYGDSLALAGANRISGIVEDGLTAKRIGGAVVFVIDAAGDTTACDFTLGDGSFAFPGLPDGSYYVAIHPLNGSAPVNFIEAGNINALVEDIVDTGFNPEWYDAAESNADDPNASSAIVLNNGNPAADIVIITNVDATGPAVLSNTPADGAVDVAVDGAYVIEFSEPVAVGSIVPAFSFRDDLTSALKGGNIAVIRDDSVLVFTPSPPLEFAKSYTLTIDTDLTDAFGNPLAADFSFTVTTEAEPPLSLTSLAPTKGVVGTTLVINGRGFKTVPAGPTVTINGVNATVESVQPNQVVITIPDGATTGPVVVTNADLTVSNALTFTVLSASEVARGYESGQVVFAQAPNALALTPDGGYAYVATPAGAEAVVVDPALSGYLTSTPIPFASGLDDVAVTSSGTRAYAISRASDELVEIMSDPTSGLLFNTVLASRALGADPKGIAIEPGGDRAYVATDESEIQVWDIRLGSPTYQQQVGVLPAPGGASVAGAMAVTPAGDRLLAATDTGDLLFFDLAADSLVDQVSVGADPRGVVVDPQGERAYVSHLAGDVSVVNIQGAPFQVQDVATGGSLRGLATTPAGLYLYVTDRELDNVKIVDLDATHSTFRTVVEDIEAPENPADIAISPEGLYAFSVLQGGGPNPARLLVTTIGAGPAVQSIVPTAALPGARVVIAGTDFGDPQDFDQASVSFNGIVVPADEHELDKIVATVPPGATSGPVQVLVRAAGETVDRTSNSLSFDVLSQFGPGGTPRFAGAMPGPGGLSLDDALAMSPKGDYILVGTTDGTIAAYDIQPGSPSYNQEINRFKPLNSAVTDITITADGRTAFAVSNSPELGTFIPVVDTDPNSPLYGKLRGVVGPASLVHQGLQCVEASPDNRFVLAGSRSRDQVYIIDAAGVGDGQAATVIDSAGTSPGNITDIEFHPTGRYAYIALTAPDIVLVLNMDKSMIEFGLVESVISMPGPAPEETPFSLDLTPDGGRLQILTFQLSGPVTRSMLDYSVTNDGLSNSLQTEFVLEAGNSGPIIQERQRISPRGDTGVRVMRAGGIKYYETDAPSTTITTTGGFETFTPNEFEYTPDGTRLYYASTFHDSVRVYDFYGGVTGVFYLAVASGDNQNGVAGQVLPAPIRATTIGEGSALPGLTMKFVAAPGNGFFVTPDGLVTEINIATDEDGFADVQWQLGSTIGVQTFQIIAEGIDLSPLTVTANATADPETLPLAIAEVLPLNASSNVSATTAVLATFSRAVDPATIGGGSLFVQLAADATLVPVTYGFTDGNRKVSLTPNAPLAFSSEYQVVYTAGIEDGSGDPLTNPGQSSFFTQAKPPLTLASVWPPSSLRGVSLVLAGTSFDPVAANNTVFFNDVPATPTSATSSTLAVIVPLDAITGTIHVQAGPESSNTLPFTVLLPNTSPIDEVIATIGTGSGAKSCAVSPDGALVYTVSPEGDVVVPVDVNGQTAYPSIAVGDQPVAIVIHPEGTFAYVANFNSGTVSVIGIDPDVPGTFNTVVATIAVGTNPIDLAVFPDGDRVLVANAGSSDVSVIDGDDTSATHHQVLLTVPSGSGAKSVAVSPDGARVYLGTDTGFTVLDANGYSVLATVPAGSGAKSLAVSPDGTLLFVLTTDGSILVVDIYPGSPSENQVLLTVPTGSGGKSVAVSGDGALLYVIQENSDEVLVFSIEVIAGVSVVDPDAAAPAFTVTTSLIDQIDTGSSPAFVAVDRSGTGTIFVTNPGAQTLTIINGSSVPLGPLAAEIVVTPRTLNLQSGGKYVGGSIELPLPYFAQEIDFSSIRLEETIPAVPGSGSFQDADGDGIEELHVKFDRAAFQAVLPQGEEVPVTITGLARNRPFAGEDTIRTTRPTVTHPHAGMHVMPGQGTYIAWTNPSGPAAEKADVHVSLDDGATWSVVAQQVANTGVVGWTAPAGFYDACRVMVTLWRNGEVYGQGMSQEAFVITMPLPTLLKSFEIAMEEGTAVLRWETGIEEGMAGFAVVRSESEGGVYRAVTTGTIPASGETDGARYEYRDESVLANRTYWYKLQEVTAQGETGMEFGPYRVEYRLNYGLDQNMPNPFNPVTTIRYALAADGPVTLTIYDVSGARVRELVNGTQRADVHRVTWDGTNDHGERVASGMYFYKLVAGKYTQTRKMMLLK